MTFQVSCPTCPVDRAWDDTDLCASCDRCLIYCCKVRPCVGRPSAECTCAPKFPGHECTVRTPAEEAASAHLNKWTVQLYDDEIRELIAIVRPHIEAEVRAAIAAAPSVVWADPGRQGGQACLRGSRLPVQIVLDYLAEGFTDDDVIDAYPGVTREQLAYLRTWTVDTEGPTSLQSRVAECTHVAELNCTGCGGTGLDEPGVVCEPCSGTGVAEGGDRD